MFPISEEFDSLSSDWLLSGSALVTDGHLSLTEATNNQAGSGVYNVPFPSSLGTNVQFDYFSGNGNGADGISFYLLDGSVETPLPGGYGGALGYSYISAEQPGVYKGYVGVGLDEYGNFLNDSFYPTGIGFAPDHVGLRGSGTLPNSGPTEAEYDYIENSAVDTSDWGGIDGGWRKVSMTVYPDQRISMCMSWDEGKTWKRIYSKLDFASQNLASGYTLPPTFKFGFSGGTGGLNNQHLIDHLNVGLPVDLSLSLTSVPNANLKVGDKVTYTLKLQNDGPYADPAAQLSATVSDSLTGVSWQVTGLPNSAFAGVGNVIGAALNLPVGESAQLTITGVVGENAAGGELLLSADLTPSAGFGDDCPNPLSYSQNISSVNANDPDGDGQTNDVDTDDDNDGLTDVEELALGSSPVIADWDGDGVNDVSDEDDDNDGIPDVIDCGSAQLALVNGSFESPYFGPGGVNYPTDDQVPGWSTSATDHIFEFWGDGFLGYNTAVGEQLVELNAYQASTLYQDVETTPGASYLYRFYHRGRNQVDTMNFYVGTTTTPVKIRTVSSSWEDWSLYYGVYTVPLNQTLSRFSFESANGTSSGNLLDGISFVPGCKLDSDNDGVNNGYDTDSDDDGLPDGVEAGHDEANPAGQIPGATGENGLSDAVETSADSGDLDYSVADSDEDGTYDFLDEDSDNDGLSDTTESELGTDPTRSDTDDDGVSDKDELSLGTDPTNADHDNDGTTDFNDDDDDNDGIPDVVECHTDTVSLINGSFELPAIAAGSIKFFPEDEVPGWDTTAGDGMMELWGTGFEGVPSAAGNQFVELNANEISTLFQTVTTVPGQTYYYRFYHRGRFQDDTMNFYLGAPGTPVLITSVTTGTEAWQQISGIYTVPEGQTLTEFSFESVTGSGAGNFLDGVSFTPGCMRDTDNDGLNDAYDLDSDSDTIPDGVESGHNQSDPAGIVPGPYGANGMANSVETGTDTGSLNYTVADHDDDDEYDFQDLDSDNDGIPDSTEAIDGTDPTSTDTDGDGLEDGEEPGLGTDPTLFDTDGDGLSDGDEVNLGSDPLDADYDDDGVGDVADEDNDNDGIPDTVECQSETVSLINGSFEEPYYGPGGVNYPSDSDVPGWDTSASDHVMEFWGTGFNGVPAAVGEQFVELNANEPSTLSQTIATTPGKTYIYRFYHRGRSGEETMNFYLGAPDQPVLIRTVTTGTEAWQLVTGIYTVPVGQTETKFSFESTNGGSSGNFLDGVSFSPACDVDTDKDGTLDKFDLDSDGDGHSDANEAGHNEDSPDGTIAGPYGANGLADSVETSADSGALNYSVQDTDNDGNYNFQDLESDGDGIPDATEGENGTNPANPDTDGDGHDDDEDLYPLDVNEWTDSDDDGIGDTADTDDDNDGTPDNNDDFPFDPTEDTDTDNDGIGNNTDADDDDDGYDDGDDAFPLDPSEWEDTDDDGLGNNEDGDDDNDGYDDGDDAFPLDPAEWEDTDDDGTGNNADSDDDNDGHNDSDDAFPLDPTEWEDTDDDGIGNNADTDDDNDTILDTDDNCPLVANTDQADQDYDGVGTICDTDGEEFFVEGTGCSCNTGSQATPPSLGTLGLSALALGLLRRRRRASRSEASAHNPSRTQEVV